MKNVPDSLADYMHYFHLKEEGDWELLRQWGLSEVWRVKMASGQSYIFKKGSGSNAREVSIYRSLLRNSRLPVPEIYDSYTERNTGILMLEDLSGETLEQAPDPGGYEAAARTLARIRMRAAEDLTVNKTGISKSSDYLVHPEQYMEDLVYISENTAFVSERQASRIKENANLIMNHVKYLYNHCPVTLVHQDYHAKNLIQSNGGMYVIDWASARLSPHLGDLYCLLCSAKESHTDQVNVLQAYSKEAGGLHSEELNWQVCIGGICWLIGAIKNLLDEGVTFIPAAVDWIPDLVDDLIKLSADLE